MLLAMMQADRSQQATSSCDVAWDHFLYRPELYKLYNSNLTTWSLFLVTFAQIYRMSWILKAVFKFNIHLLTTLMPLLFGPFLKLFFFLRSMVLHCCFVLFLQNHRETLNADTFLLLHCFWNIRIYNNFEIEHNILPFAEKSMSFCSTPSSPNMHSVTV